MLKKSQKVRYASIDGKIYAVPASTKFLMQNKYGLWFGTERKPEFISHNQQNDWTPTKYPIQLSPSQILITPVNGNWKTDVVRTTEQAPSCQEIIDCNR